MLSACVIIAGWLCVPGGSQAQDGKLLHVALAGTMEQVISRQIGPAFTAVTGYTLEVTRQSSVLLANRIGISLVDDGNERGQRRRNQDRAFPVEAGIGLGIFVHAFQDARSIRL